MFRKKTTPIKNSRKGKKSNNSRVLHLNVTSPRIMFFQSLKTLRDMGRKLIILAIVLTLGYFAYKAVYKHFNDNEEFAIKYIPVTDFKGNDTVVLSRDRVIHEISQIDLQGTVFKVDLDDVEQRLKERPEVISVKVERQLPSTIDIKIQERVPVAWLSCRELGLAGRSPHRGILLDEHGVSFQSEKGFWEIARNLPVIEVSVTSKDAFVLGRKMNHPDAERALQFVMNLHMLGPQDWGVDRVVVENFYTLNAYCNDGLLAKFSMYQHDFQLRKLLLIREHAKTNGKIVKWIDLRPKTNNPGEYVDGGAVENSGFSAPEESAAIYSEVDESTQSILDRDN